MANLKEKILYGKELWHNNQKEELAHYVCRLLFYGLAPSSILYFLIPLNYIDLIKNYLFTSVSIFFLSPLIDIFIGLTLGSIWLKYFEINENRDLFKEIKEKSKKAVIYSKEKNITKGGKKTYFLCLALIYFLLKLVLTLIFSLINNLFFSKILNLY